MAAVLDAVEPSWTRGVVKAVLPGEDILQLYSCRVETPQGARGATRTIALIPHILVVVDVVHLQEDDGFPIEKVDIRSIPLRRVASVSEKLTTQENPKGEMGGRLGASLEIALTAPEERLHLPFSDKDMGGPNRDRIERMWEFGRALVANL